MQRSSLRATRLVVAAFAMGIPSIGAVAFADDGSPPGYGVLLGDGSRVRADIRSADESDDVDDYLVRVEAGRVLRVTVEAEARGALVPDVQLLHSDGTLALTEVADAAGRVRLRVPAGPTETWKVRVRGRRPETDAVATTGAYTVAVQLEGRVGTRARDVAPDADGLYRFALPAAAGARIDASLRFSGAAPVFVGLVAPDGEFVAGAGDAIRSRRGAVSLDRFRVPDSRPFGDYTVVFGVGAAPAGDVRFDATVRGSGAPRRRGVLSPLEPWLGAVVPSLGADGAALTLSARNVEDRRQGAPFRLTIGGIAATDARLEFVDTYSPSVLRATVPAGLAPGRHDVAVETATGQVAVLVGGYVHVASPTVVGLSPVAVATAGGADVTITGTGFRPGRMGIRIGGHAAPVVPSDVTPTSIRFAAPSAPAGGQSVGVVDLDTGRAADLAAPLLEWVPWATISGVAPAVVTVLGGDTVAIDGDSFAATDSVRLETAAATFETVPSSFDGPRRHSFVAPVRPKGRYRVVVDDNRGHLSAFATLTYVSYADVTANSASLASGGVEAASTALGDFDGDGDADLFVTQRATGAAAATSRTRVFRNDGGSGFAEITATSFPAASAADDWRGDRIQAADVTGDGFADVVLGTSDATVPGAGRSRVRILVSELRAPDAAVTDRVLRDRTADLFPAPRTMSALYGAGGNLANDVDDWSASDLWVGDLDPATDGPPEIVVTTDRTFANQYVSCTPYCASPYSGGYAYSMYWGGTRVFRWNPAARSGLGRFKLDTSALPRKAAVPVWYWGAPPGSYTLCNPTTPCAGTFTPFTGRHLAVGRIDGDAKLDIAVLAETPPIVRGAPQSVLQVALSRAAANAYPSMNDATNAVTALGADLPTDAIAIGRTGWPDGAGLGLIALSRSAPGASALRLLRYLAATDPLTVGTFDDVTQQVLPLPLGADPWQADALRFADVDQDGADDLVLLSRTPPNGASSGLRILRNTTIGATKGLLRPFAGSLLDTAAGADPLAGDVLTVGDLDAPGAPGRGFPDFIVTRSAAPGAGPATRVVVTDR